MIIDQRQWEAFAREHHCRIVGKMDGDTAVGVASTSNGGAAVITTTTSGKTGFLCDDGITYWRSN